MYIHSSKGECLIMERKKGAGNTIPISDVNMIIYLFMSQNLLILVYFTPINFLQLLM
jgi:hypothetical protein